MSRTFEQPNLLSHWFNQMYGEQPIPMRPQLQGDVDADVCIVGAGYTGLWTAYYLLKESPDIKIAIVEAKISGYGASGRNGGALIAQFNGSREYWLKRTDRAGLLAFERAVHQSVDDVGQAVKESGIDCSYSKNGVVMVARNELELTRFQDSVDEDRDYNIGEDFSRMLTREEVLSRINIDGAIGARLNLSCASINPGKLARGLADAVERLGATIYEGSPVTKILSGAAITEIGRVKAKFIVRATEAYTESFQTNKVVPVHTSMLVTEQIPEKIWNKIGWSGQEALLAEHPFLHLQHTPDHRITIGGDDNRIPYLYGSKPSPDGPTLKKVADMHQRELVRLFPVLQNIKIESSWQGIFGATRHWAPSTILDEKTGLITAGGYVGEGLAFSNLTGQTTADLILGHSTPLTKLPFVGNHQRNWEPEPFRYLGAVGISWMRHVGERNERRTGKHSLLFDWGNRIAGFTGNVG